MQPEPDDTAFDRALIAAAFERMAETGWTRLRVADAARAAGLPLDRARIRFPCKSAVLVRFGRMADQAALDGATTDGTAKDRLFDVLMRRIDVLQAHRAGVLALFRSLPADPATALMLGATSLMSMGWMLDGAGLSAAGPIGKLRAKGLLAVWLWTVRAWERDTGEDLAATMAALDKALDRAGQVETWLRREPPQSRDDAADAPFEPPAGPESAPDPA